MPTTPTLALPYPASTDPADVPADIKRLADALDGLKLAAGTELGYDQITAPVTVSSGTESAGTVVIAGSAHAFDGAPVLAEFFAPAIAPTSVLGAALVVCLFEGATQIGRLCVIINPAAQNMQTPGSGRLRFTPSAGSHTYSVTGFQTSGNGAVNAGAGGTTAYVPAFLRFTKV